jgi:ABC-type sulfate transport system permease component
MDLTRLATEFDGAVLFIGENTEDDVSTGDVTIKLAVNEGEYEAHKNATISILCVSYTSFCFFQKTLITGESLFL